MKVDVKYTKLFINNEWVDSVSGDSFATLNPATEQEICQVAAASREDVDIFMYSKNTLSYMTHLSIFNISSLSL